MTRTKQIILASAVAAGVVAAVAVKWIFFPSIKDTYFTMNQQSLRQAPSGLVVVRPTHFPKSSRKGIMSDTVQVSGKPVWRVMGRNVSFKQLVAMAYGRREGRVALPADAPQGNFDFLVTVRGDQQQSLQKAVRKELGYIAQTETRDASVLALKIKNGNLPGLVVSEEGAKENVDFRDGKLYFTHLKLQAITGNMEQMLKLPVVDKTDLTNFYDFSTTWDPKTQMQMRNDATARAAVEKILNNWGLGLEPENEPVELLVVKSAS